MSIYDELREEAHEMHVKWSFYGIVSYNKNVFTFGFYTEDGFYYITPKHAYYLSDKVKDLYKRSLLNLDK